MKFKTITACLLIGVFATFAFAGEPTTTRARDINQPEYRTVKHTFTATTGLDSIVILNENNRVFETHELKADSALFAIAFQTAETTANNSDWDVLWQVTGQNDASATAAFPGEAGAGDWVTVETDQNDNSLAWVVRFNAAPDYRGYNVRALLCEADGTADAAVAIEVSAKYARK